MKRMSWKILGIPLFLAATAAFANGPAPISILVNGANGAGVATIPGRPCAAGGEGAGWLYDYSANVPAGRFSSLASRLELQLDVHSSGVGVPPAYNRAWLDDETTLVEIENERGSVTLAMTAGDCNSNPLNFNGSQVSGNAVWEVIESDGSLREATGNGTSQVTATVGRGTRNPFSLRLRGEIQALSPGLAVELISAVWNNGNSKAPFKTASVTYKITNVGPGDAYDVRLVGANSPVAGILGVGPLPQSLGDMYVGDTAIVNVSYRLDQAFKPCKGTQPSCTFGTRLSVEMPDALDQPGTQSQAVRIRVPTNPQLANGNGGTSTPTPQPNPGQGPASNPPPVAPPANRPAPQGPAGTPGAGHANPRAMEPRGNRN